ncbi:ester cyclase [Hymenobacter busanensis]|uniref:Ester cyclase n=1 Tax=Hymenobacter busanensis TaxID=2607656 RepID=A0A7L4ZTM1_9BACT|nr:ester cyclase [Hymenobacter busanensis]KAA9327516.1 ester cyclase [Hymenobacter busanensis]QHJ06146.1 hypothetical protein GUY19_02070 [Hymenobacter busanensis]
MKTNTNSITGCMLSLIYLLSISACDNKTPSINAVGNIIAADSVNVNTPTNNKQLVLKLYQALNDTNWALARTLIDKDFKHHFVKGTGFADVPWSGFEQGYRMSQQAFPDWKLTPIQVVAEGEYVSTLLSGQGTHLG